MLRGMLLALALGAALPASAAVTVTVNGQARPWDWVKGGLNDSLQFGIQDGVGPAVATFASAGISAGGSFAVVYKSGLTSAFGGTPTVDQNGYVGSIFKDDDPGSSGNFFPSHYMPTLWSSDPGAGVFLNALVFAFTDASGKVLGGPDAMEVQTDGFGGFVFVSAKSGFVPAGATQIQLGLNDDIFGDNTGALRVCVGADVAACSFSSGGVPEPATWAMMIGGLGLAGVALRRRRRAYATA